MEAGDMQLTPTQIQHYDTFGFLVIPDFLSQEMAQALRDRLTEMKTEESGEADPLRHRGRLRNMFHTDPLQLELFDDLRLHAIAVQLLREENVRFLGDEYASFSTPADWHPDTLADAPYEALKFGFYLDDLSRGGCLRVVPGSQHREYSASVQAFRSSQDPAPEIENAHSCLTNPGDLLIFNLKIWHQGTENPAGTYRRVIFWSVGQDKPEFAAAAREMHKTSLRGGAEDAWPESILLNAPTHRKNMLDVYDAESVKHKQLA
jgi:hypothetical protein